jgi:hypothetical protein
MLNHVIPLHSNINKINFCEKLQELPCKMVNLSLRGYKNCGIKLMIHYYSKPE